MSYNFDTSKTSPNSTSSADSYRTFGRARTIEAIAIHHWGAQTASYEGTVATLMNPAAGVSAHFVATGTGRRVAQLVDFDRVSWATNSANPYTISIECDPRCRDEDYDVVAEVIAQIWDAYGYLPLVPHRQFVATACPGNYDLGRLERIAHTKDGSGDWGNVTDKNATPPPAPEQPEPVYDNLYRLFLNGNQMAAYSVDENAYNGYVNYGSTGKVTYRGQDVTSALVDKFKPKPTPEEPKPEPEQPKPEEPKEPETPEEPPKQEDSLNVFIRALKKFWLLLVDIWNAKQ